VWGHKKAIISIAKVIVVLIIILALAKLRLTGIKTDEPLSPVAVKGGLLLLSRDQG
jgi:hypothetical protein